MTLHCAKHQYDTQKKKNKQIGGKNESKQTRISIKVKPDKLWVTVIYAIK